MKRRLKTAFISLMLLTAVSLPSHGQDYRSSYTSLGDIYKVEADLPSNEEEDLFCYVQIQGEYKNDEVSLLLVGEDAISEFRASLFKLKDKFSEWEKVAKKNNVTSFDKYMNIEFPNTKIGWKGSEWFLDTGEDIDFRFVVLEDGMCAVTASGKAVHWENEYITQKWYIMFKTTDEIESLIKAIAPEAILKCDNRETDKLFN